MRTSEDPGVDGAGGDGWRGPFRTGDGYPCVIAFYIYYRNSEPEGIIGGSIMGPGGG